MPGTLPSISVDAKPNLTQAVPSLFLARLQGLRACARTVLLLLGCAGFIGGAHLRAAPVEEIVSATGKAPKAVETFEAAWRIIHETYFDPTFNGLDWNAVRKELLPKAEAAATTRELRAVIENMLRRLDASHMGVIPGDLEDEFEESEAGSDDSIMGNGDPGLEVRVVNKRVLVTRVEAGGAAAAAGIKPGWIIDAIDGRKTADLLQPWAAEWESLPKQFLAWRRVTGQLSGPVGSTVRVDCLDAADRAVSVPVVRGKPRGAPAKLGDLPTLYAHLESEGRTLPGGGTAGLIRFNVWMIPIVRALDAKIDQFRHADGIILDLRGNLGGLGGMIVGVSGHFLNERVSLGTLKMRGSELNFFANPRRVNSAGERVEPYSGPVAILVDALSLSAAEIFAGGMQAVGRARVFGERTGGQALPAVWDRLPNGDVLYHAFGDFIIPSGKRLEGRGVVPDELVPLRREDLLEGKDAPLEAALRWISESKRNGKGARTPAPE